MLAFAKGLVDDCKALADRWEGVLMALQLSTEQEFAASHEGEAADAFELVDFAKGATAAARDDVRLAEVAPEGLRIALTEQFRAVHGVPPDGDAQSLRLLDRLVDYLEAPPAAPPNSRRCRRASRWRCSTTLRGSTRRRRRSMRGDSRSWRNSSRRRDTRVPLPPLTGRS